MRLVVSLIVLWGFVLSTGCQANPVAAGVPVEITSSPIAESPSTSVPVSATQGATPGLQILIEKAKAELAQRLSFSVTQINFLEASEVVWSDASLGCPQPGTVYTQVSTSGFLIHLEAGGKVYEYHADFNERVILCEAPRPSISPVKPGAIQDGQPWMPP